MRTLVITAALMGAIALPVAPALALDWGNVLEGAKAAAEGLTITDADELAMGQAISAEVLADTPALGHAGVQAYVTQVGKRLAAQAKSRYAFTFTVIDSDEVNAFAAPGGFVFVTTGALRSMKSEAELAGVLGHEIAHVVQRHGVEGIKKAMLAQGLATAAVGDQSKLVRMGTEIGMNLILKGFDRAAESESDDLGSKYAAGAGYDPKGIEDFLTTLAASGEGPIWLMPVASHPRSDDRVKALAAKRPATAKAPFVGKENYKQSVLAVIGAAGKQ
jgi:predicted Zn-dependent protease